MSEVEYQPTLVDRKGNVLDANLRNDSRHALLQSIHNPFSTCRVRPGALPFETRPDTSLDNLLRQLEEQGWRGTIVGPHGSGKSTLLMAIVARLAELGHATWVIALREDQRRLPRDLAAEATRRGAKLLAIDGYERLAHWRRWRLNRCCRRQGLGLLVTSHDRLPLPLLYATSPTVELAESLAARLLGDEWNDAFRARLRHSFRLRKGDIREVFFDLYDLYESRRGEGRRSADPAPRINPAPCFDPAS